MKLLIERKPNFDVKLLDANDNLFFESIFIQMDIRNRNDRFYPSEDIAPIIEQYIKDQVVTGGAVGELDHPANPNLNSDRVSHRIVELRREGNNYIGKALILENAMGNVLRSFVKGGVRFGVSTRAVGKVSLTTEGYERVGTPFVLVTAGDAVLNPSAPDAYAQAVMESAEWVLGADGKWVSRIVEESKVAIQKAPSAQLNNVKFEQMKRFLNAVGRK